jgi:hypothetical protein
VLVSASPCWEAVGTFTVSLTACTLRVDTDGVSGAFTTLLGILVEFLLLGVRFDVAGLSLARIILSTNSPAGGGFVDWVILVRVGS